MESTECCSAVASLRKCSSPEDACTQLKTIERLLDNNEEPLTKALDHDVKALATLLSYAAEETTKEASAIACKILSAAARKGMLQLLNGTVVETILPIFQATTCRSSTGHWLSCAVDTLSAILFREFNPAGASRDEVLSYFISHGGLYTVLMHGTSGITQLRDNALQASLWQVVSSACDFLHGFLVEDSKGSQPALEDLLAHHEELAEYVSGIAALLVQCSSTAKAAHLQHDTATCKAVALAANASLKFLAGLMCPSLTECNESSFQTIPSILLVGLLTDEVLLASGGVPQAAVVLRLRWTLEQSTNIPRPCTYPGDSAAEYMKEQYHSLDALITHFSQALTSCRQQQQRHSEQQAPQYQNMEPPEPQDGAMPTSPLHHQQLASSGADGAAAGQESVTLMTLSSAMQCLSKLLMYTDFNNIARADWHLLSHIKVRGLTHADRIAIQLTS